VSKDDFEVKNLIGKGGFGQVYLAIHKPTNRVMALKQMNKQLIKDKGKIEHIKNERRILIKGKSPYLVRLHYAFRDEESLYLAMEYCSGGDLKKFLGVIGFLEEAEARLYFAEMIMGVYTLHQLGYIHRDLKPDNFLIDSRGHLKLADFGLSKAGVEQSDQSISSNYPNLTEEEKQRVQEALVNNKQQDDKYLEDDSLIDKNSLLPSKAKVLQEELTKQNLYRRFRRTESFLKLGNQQSQDPVERVRIYNNRKFIAHSVVGSPDYMSPEVTSKLDENDPSPSTGYGEEVDWWSLGCVFFEMILGAPPFEGDTPHEIFTNINQWENIIPNLLDRYQDHMSPDFKQLLEGMLCEKENRLGRDIDQLKAHPFFAGIDWDHLHEIEAPFVPMNPPEI